MSKCFFGLLARVVVAGFFALSAWNCLQDLESQGANLSTKYKTFQERVTLMSGQQFHQHIDHQTVSKFAEQIVEYLSYLILTLCVFSMLKPCFGKWVVIIWVLTQFLEHEFLELTQNRNLKQLEVVALTMAVAVSGWLVNSTCASKATSCGKTTTSKTTTKSGKASTSNKSKRSRR